MFDVNKRTSRVTHKHGVDLLTSFTHAKKLDDINSNTLWMCVINREIENLKIAFYILKNGAKIPVGYNKSSGQLVFDVHMTLERKSLWEKDGDRNPEPEWPTFSIVASIERVSIELTCVALNDLSVYYRNIQNAYLQDPSSEKYHVICSPDFALENMGKYAIIVRSLHGGKNAGADYR